MKQNPIERTMQAVETFHLGLLVLCLSLPLTLLVFRGSLTDSLLWGFGVLVPAELLCFLGRRIETLLPRILACLAVLALAIFLPDTWGRRFTWGLCCLPVFLAATVLPRPDGKLMLTVPKLYHPIAPLQYYAFCGIFRLPPLASALAVTIALLMVLTILVHANQARLLSTLRSEGDTAISVQSILRLNRRTLVIFALLALVAILAVPMLTRRMPARQEETPVYTGETAALEQTEPLQETELPDIVVEKPSEHTISYRLAENITLAAVVLALVGMVGLCIATLIRELLAIRSGKRRTSSLRGETFVVETLEEKEQEAEDDAAEAYTAKLRRRYARLIRRRTDRTQELAPMSPAELEQAANLGGSDAAREIHRLYEKARYGPAPATREEDRAMKAALKELPE